jgi:cytochrome c oxidase subunit 2
MLAPVRVLPRADFDAWVAAETDRLAALETSAAARGAQLYETQGCKACHSLDGSVLVGPSWQNLFGSQEPLADGSSVTVDEDYIRNSILKPGEQLVEGFNNLMPPTCEDMLTETDVEDIIAFLQSLQD